MGVREIIEGIIRREGGYVDDSRDRGGPTKYGITLETARAAGYTGSMQELGEDQAHVIYYQLYFLRPGFGRVRDWELASGAAQERITEELVDTGVNMGPGTAIRFLQRALNALNLEGKLYADVAVDGVLGPGTMQALAAFGQKRGAGGRAVLLKALNCLQGARYIELAEGDERQETFVYGWLEQRIGI